MPKYKKLYTFEDLYTFLEKNGKNVNFNAKETKTVFAVQMEGKAVFEDTSTKGLTKVHIKAVHSGMNKNHFNLTDEATTDAMPSLKTRPILAHIRDVNGQEEFGGHDFVEDDEGNRVEYYEIPVGVTSSTEEPYMEYDAEMDKTYVHTEGYIFDDYNNAKDLIQRDGSEDVSVEIIIEAFSYDAFKHEMTVNGYYFDGVTILGKDDHGNEINPACAGANITLADFQLDEKSSSFFSANKQAEFVETVDKLAKMLATFQDTQSQKKGGTKPGMFEKLLQKYGKTKEDITFAYQDMSDAELEAKFKEIFDGEGGEGGEGAGDGAGDAGEAGDEGTGAIVGDGNDGGNDDDDDDDDEGDEPDDSDSTKSTGKTKTKKQENQINAFSITTPMGKQFSISLNEKIAALSEVVNATYAEADNDYYFVTVFEEYVVMESWCTGKHYKQSYTAENETTFSLTGERVEVFTEYLTKEEMNTLKVIRGEYSVLKEYHEKNEAEKATAAKAEVFSDFDEVLKNNEEYEKLKKSELSADELRLQCNALVGAQQMAVFSANRPKQNKVTFAAETKTDRSPYGGLFDEDK